MFKSSDFIMVEDNVFSTIYKHLDGTTIEDVYEDGWIVRDPAGEILNDFRWFAEGRPPKEWEELFHELAEIKSQLDSLFTWEYWLEETSNGKAVIWQR